MADTGWKYAGSAADQGGLQSWTNTGNATGSNTGTYAYCVMSAASNSNALRLTGFDFSALPSDATIDGIQVAIYAAEGGAGDLAVDARLVIEGTPSGATKNTALTTTPMEYVLGNSTDKWSLTPTPAQLKAGTSGIELVFTNDPFDSSEARAYYVGIKIYYTPAAGGDWWDTDWTHRIEGTIDAAYVDEEIPVVPVWIPASATAWFAAVQSDGDDIRVFNGDDTVELDYYIVNINTGTPVCMLLVNVAPIIDTVTDAPFRVYAGNALASAASSSSAVFTGTNYAAYYLPGMTTTDLTGNGFNLTAVNSPGTVASQWDGLTSATYSASRHTSSSSPVSDWPLTIDHLTLYSSLASARVAMGIGNTSGGANNYVYTYTSGSSLQSYVKGASGSFASTNISSAVAVDTWYSLALSRDANTGTSAAYIDNTSATNTTTITTPSFNGLSIGSEYDNSIGIPHAGSVAQAAVSSVVRSANFVATNYDAWFTSGFITWGAVEEAPTGEGADVTGTAQGDVSLTASALGYRGVLGTSGAAVDVAATASGFKGLLGTVAAALDAAATATGFKAVFGSALAALDVAASAVGLGAVVGTARAALDLTASALGFKGLFGTAAAEMDLSAYATDFEGGSVGTAQGEVDVTARAWGYVGTLGPADGASVVSWLTGASATGAPQRDADESDGGFRSGVRFRAMQWDTEDPLIGAQLLEAGGGNAPGVGSLTGDGADAVTWTPPGLDSEAGAAVTLAVGADVAVAGADSGAWLRVRRTAANPLVGAHAITVADVYNNLFPDVASADAVAGLETTRALMLRNDGGTVTAFRAWLDDCDDSFEFALEQPTAGELTGTGLTWSSATTAGTGLTLPVVAADQEIGLWLRRTIAADSAPSARQFWGVRWDYGDGSATYESGARGLYRIERDDYEAQGIWVGIGEYPDLEAAPDETWTSTPHTTSLGLSLPATVYVARRARNRWGLWGAPTAIQRFNLDTEGDSTRVAPSGPSDVTAGQTAGNLPTAGAEYDAAADGDDRAQIWVVWLATDGTDPDGSGTPDGYAVMQWNAAIDDLAFIGEGDALADGTPVSVLVRTRRLDSTGGTAFSPDVIQLDDSDPGPLKVDAEISDWDSSGYFTITNRFGRLLEVGHYSGIAVSDGQTTVTVDERALMGTTATATGPSLIITPVVAVDSENTDTASWTITAVAPGRPLGQVMLGTAASQGQGPVTGPDGVTPVVLSGDVHLVLGVGWSSLYVDTTLVWRAIYHGPNGEDNGLYIPSEWTRVTGAVTGAASGSGVVDVVDADTVYLCVNGQRRVLIDLAAMEITAAAWNAEEALGQKAEQDGTLGGFGATWFLVWDAEREEYRPVVEVESGGDVNIETEIVESMNAAAVAAIWE